MAIDLTALKTEINTDPVVIGYAGKNDPEVANLLNSVQTGQTIVRNDEIPTWQIFERFDPTEYVNAVNVDMKYKLITHLLAMGTINLGGSNMRDLLIQVFGVGSQTITRLSQIRSRVASRAEVLFGAGIQITPSDVANARRA